MKLLIASDLHGSAVYTEKLIAAFAREKAEKLILLGDLLYHGPRNDLPEEYGPKKVIDLLESVKDKILAVRGNCDTEVDQAVLSFPIMAPYAYLFAEGVELFCTHGHLYSFENLPPLSADTVFLQGHTHTPFRRVVYGTPCLNPGSVSLPRGGSFHSYMTLQNGVFEWKTLEGVVFDRFDRKEERK